MDKTAASLLGSGYAAGLVTGALAASVYFLLSRQPTEISEIALHTKELEDLERLFHIPPSKLQQLFKHFVGEMTRGLTEEGSTMKMIPSFVQDVPSGSEMGSYLALDLGGTNFRVVRVIFEGQGSARIQQNKFLVSEELKTGKGEDLFDFFAASVDSFMEEFEMDRNTAYKMGFTFSFPVKQTSINSGILFEWTKGFSASEVVGKDVVGLLNQAFKKRNIKVDVVALANDTVGTLATRAYRDSQCYVGVIFGTGTNAAYIEKVSEIPKWKGQDKSGKMIINMEWGSFDDTKQHLPLTVYDLILDRESPNPGKQLYEKMISGMYLGEMTRIICVDFIKKGKLFRGYLSGKFDTPHAFDTAYMSRIERDHSRDLSDTAAVLEDVMGVKSPDVLSRQMVKRICELVGVRAARMSAVGIAGVVSKMNMLSGCSVAVDGSVFQHYPHFENRMRDALTEIFGMQAENISFHATQDGSGIGAALIAAVASK